MQVPRIIRFKLADGVSKQATNQYVVDIGTVSLVSPARAGRTSVRRLIDEAADEMRIVSYNGAHQDRDCELVDPLETP